MLKLYAILLLILSSCATKISYVGAKTNPVAATDVFVTETNIQRPYKIMGKGFVKPGSFDRNFEETMQRKSVKQAKKIGADAVLFLDYAVQHPVGTISSVIRTDSIANGSYSVGQTTLAPTISYGFTILFLKYLD
ncbi:hypothetical protein [Lacibacter sp. H407]|uniref:hypothetical protein n=1 Tax=Lacibacter sp. H407 TaxID=3133423 RepID=UPI0030BD3F9C